MNEQIDWKKKLTSRKLWAAVCSLVANLIIALGGTEDQTVKITALIMAGASVIAYIIGEGLVDAADRKNGSVVIQLPEDEPPEEEEEEDEEDFTEEEVNG